MLEKIICKNSEITKKWRVGIIKLTTFEILISDNLALVSTCILGRNDDLTALFYRSIKNRSFLYLHILLDYLLILYLCKFYDHYRILTNWRLASLP